MEGIDQCAVRMRRIVSLKRRDFGEIDPNLRRSLINGLACPLRFSPSRHTPRLGVPERSAATRVVLHNIDANLLRALSILQGGNGAVGGALSARSDVKQRAFTEEVVANPPDVSAANDAEIAQAMQEKLRKQELYRRQVLREVQ